jgi:hypothetical protein
VIDYGNWAALPDYREGLQDKNQSGIARLGQMLDPSTYIPGINQITNPIHQGAEQIADSSNRALSPIVGAAQKFTNVITPGMSQLQNAIPTLKNIDTFVRDKPVDAAAIAAATFFSAGAATPYLAGAGTGAAGGLSAGGAAATEGALAGTTAGGAGALGGLGAAGTAAGEAALTPAFSGLASTAGSAAPGLLGSTGTAALNSALTPALASIGTAAPSGVGSLLNTFNTAIKPLKTGYKYGKNLNSFSHGDTEGQRQQNMANAFNEQVLNNNPTPDNIGKVSNAMTQFRGFR